MRHTSPNPEAMTKVERSAALWLSSIFALRMLGLFMLLPIFAIHAAELPDGHNPTLIGLAMGSYGLTQALMQIPMGWMSDRWGRKPIILAGLGLFVLGSVVGALADSVIMLLLARCLQGAGAISAAITAYLADLTRDSQRSKAMAIIGIGIALTFALSLVAATPLYQAIGLGGMFMGMAVLGLLAMLIVHRQLPLPPQIKQQHETSLSTVMWLFRQGDLLRLNAGIFILHCTQIALFVALPGQLVSQLGLPLNDHWHLYLPVVLASFVLMAPILSWTEKNGRHKFVLCCGIALMVVVQAMIGWSLDNLVAITACLLMYFIAFNLLEASLPSWVSRVVPPSQRGLALGFYNTSQALGLFSGGLFGGMLIKLASPATVFFATSALCFLWLLIAQKLNPIIPRQIVTSSLENEHGIR